MHIEMDKRLRDEAIIDEIEMSTNLMICASHSPTPLTQAQIDAAIGL
jgi:hypothetical protein